MQYISTIIVAIITATSTIITAIISKNTNKKVDNIENVRKELTEEIKKMHDNHNEEMNNHILEADKTFLTNYLSDVEQNIPKTEIQKMRAYEIYQEYRSKNGNSYIHDKWEELKEKNML